MEWQKGKLQFVLGLPSALTLKGPLSLNTIGLFLNREQFKTSPSAPKILLQMSLCKHLKEKHFYATLLKQIEKYKNHCNFFQNPAVKSSR